MKCAYCHITAETAERATIPSAAKCETCHQKDVKFAPGKPVYVLPDFVFFSHAKHATAKIACDTCHGNLWRQEKIESVLSMKMKACVDCHKAHDATTVCTKCHDLSQ